MKLLFKKTNLNTGRQIELDIARGLAALFMIAVLVIISACGGEKIANEGVEIAAEATDVQYQLPQDHRLHKDQKYRTENFQEWLYFTGALTNQNDLYGYEVNLFSNYDKSKGFFYQLDIAISDVKSQRFYSDSIYFPTEDRVYHDTSRNEDVWEYQDADILLRHYEKTDIWELRVKSSQSASPFSIDLTLKNEKRAYYPNSPSGIVSMGNCKQGNLDDMKGLSYYYSHPQLSTTGNLAIDSKTLTVSGDTWFDHQWGNFADCPMNWDWFSLRLNDGSYMMLFGLNKANRKTPLLDGRFAAYFLADGRVEYRTGKDAFSITPLRYLNTDIGRIGIDWLIETPFGKFGVKPYFDNQMMPSYYEGIFEIRQNDLNGQVIGVGYQEH